MILPVVLYHGKKRWNAPLQFAELIEARTNSHVPHYRPVFVDLTEIPDERITGSLWAVLGLVALKYSRLAIATNIIRAAYGHNTAKLVNLRSSCIYPKHAPQPMKAEHLLTIRLRLRTAAAPCRCDMAGQEREKYLQDGGYSVKSCFE